MMKKKVWIVLVIFLGVIVVLGMITNYADTARVTTGHEPQFCIKMVSRNGGKVTYWGLGYKVIRYVGVSPNEPYESNIGVKMGSWFMKYDLPDEKSIMIEYEGKTIEITNHNDVSRLENILVNSKYISPICDGINTHKITLDNEIYYIKESCREIQKGEKQSSITKEDLDTILKIIEDNE